MEKHTDKAACELKVKACARMTKPLTAQHLKPLLEMWARLERSGKFNKLVTMPPRYGMCDTATAQSHKSTERILRTMLLSKAESEGEP